MKVILKISIGHHSLACNITDDSYLWDISSYGKIDSVLIRVTANDGFGGTAVDESDYIFFIDHTPIPTETSGSALSSSILSSTIGIGLIILIIRRKQNKLS